MKTQKRLLVRVSRQPALTAPVRWEEHEREGASGSTSSPSPRALVNPKLCCSWRKAPTSCQASGGHCGSPRETPREQGAVTASAGQGAAAGGPGPASEDPLSRHRHGFGPEPRQPQAPTRKAGLGQLPGVGAGQGAEVWEPCFLPSSLLRGCCLQQPGTRGANGRVVRLCTCHGLWRYRLSPPPDASGAGPSPDARCPARRAGLRTTAR